NRFSVSPATEVGRPARIAATRAVLWPCEPCGWPEPMMTSPASLGWGWGRVAAAPDHFPARFRVELRDLAQDVLDCMGREVVGPGEIERAAERLGQRRPRAGDEDGFSHEGLLC